MDTKYKKDHPDDGRLGHRHNRFPMAVAKANFDFQALELGLNDPKVTGRQLLEAAGFRPAEEYLLFQLLDNGAIEERRLDETAELRENRTERFIAFKSDRSFRVEVDRRRFEWGASELTGLIAKQMTGAEILGTGVWLERRDGPDIFIEDTDVVSLAAKAIERLRTGPVCVLWIEGEAYRWLEPTITTEQVAELGGWDTSVGVQQIDLATNEARTLKPGEIVDLKKIKTFAKKIGWRRG